MNVYSYNTDLDIDGNVIGLEVTQTEHKSFEDIQMLLSLGKPSTVVDKFIELYLPTTDPEQIAADKWYERHQLVLTLDPLAPKVDILDISGVVIGQEPNDYDLALQSRTDIESTNPWLLTLRGLVGPARPVFAETVTSFRAANIDYRDERQIRYINELSPEGNFEKTVGDMFDAVINALTGDNTALLALKVKIDQIKSDIPKR